MAKLPIEMLREHRFIEDARGTARVLPRGWAGELDEEQAVIAIASGVARARVELNDEQKKAVAVVQAALAGDHERVAELMPELVGKPKAKGR